jgi:hypothetical protein
MKKVFALFVLTILLSACWSTPYPKSATSDPYAPDYVYQPVSSYKSVLPILNYSGTASVLLVVHDQRPYVVSEKTKQQYTGHIRRVVLWGPTLSPPIDLITDDGRSLADTVSGIVSDAMKKAGFSVETVRIEPKEKITTDSLNKYGLQKYDKIIIVVINEWMTEEFYNLGFFYAVSLTVYNNAGVQAVATTEIKGEDDLGGKGESREKRDVLINGAITKRLSELLNNDGIKKAL